MMWSPTLSSSLTLNALILTVLTLKLSQIELNVFFIGVCTVFTCQHADIKLLYPGHVLCMYT